jgi:penicillin-insensitive murein endopeptidase
VRFFNPVAQTTGYLTHDLLVEHGIVETPVHTTTHTARRGDTLGKLARRYGTTIAALKQANGLRSSKIIAGRGYRVPQVKTRLPRPVLLPRLLPPEPSDSSQPVDSPERCPPLSRPSSSAQGASRQPN